MLDNLSGPMLELALEELKNMQFEMDMLNRNAQRSSNTELVANEGLQEPVMHSW